MTWGADPLVSLPFVAALMFCFGVAIYYLLIRRVLTGSMQSQIFATFGLMVFLQAGAQFVMGADYFAIREQLAVRRRQYRRPVLPVPQFAAVVGASLATALLYSLVFRTSIGRSCGLHRRIARPRPRSAST